MFTEDHHEILYWWAGMLLLLSLETFWAAAGHRYSHGQIHVDRKVRTCFQIVEIQSQEFSTSVLDHDLSTQLIWDFTCWCEINSLELRNWFPAYSCPLHTHRCFLTCVMKGSSAGEDVIWPYFISFNRPHIERVRAGEAQLYVTEWVMADFQSSYCCSCWLTVTIHSEHKSHISVTCDYLWCEEWQQTLAPLRNYSRLKDHWNSLFSPPTLHWAAAHFTASDLTEIPHLNGTAQFVILLFVCYFSWIE